MNCNTPRSNPADNIPDVYRRCISPKWGKTSPQISINKVLATYPIYVILLKF